ncbi:MAG: glutamate racemase [Desulfuromonas sp.]|nr:MAG: glutamate racemase [Desulfuromonas sp.]
MGEGKAIGIFDSGVGGLTVLKEIAARLPDEDLIYLGDTARVPYGTKSPETVQRYAIEAARFLVDRGVRMLVVACNTASAVALDLLKETFDLPVVGVIEPGAARAVALSGGRRIGVIGTEGTVKSGAYTRAIHSLDQTLNVVSVACPLFVPLAEEGWAGHEIAALAAREYLAPIREEIDTLVLGCTHYPLLKETLSAVLGENVQLVDSAEETAIIVAEYSQNRPPQNRPRRISFFVTDVPTRFERVGRAFLGAELDDVRQVTLKESPAGSL